MQTYVVGGAVRDELLGLPVQDRDHVVVGATPEQMIALGYTAVGKDFPVFLHPVTHEEHALARTERKTAPGYKGFAFHAAPDVTLEQDLIRRDLTINAMARASDGTLIDPFGGRRDLKARVFRHVSAAFSEDPVRILRVARFAARYPDFTVAPETNDLMRQMVQQGEVDALVPERVWQELARGLMEATPSRMFDVLRACGALDRILPELDVLWGARQSERDLPNIDTGVHVMRALDCAAKRGYPLPIRFATVMHDLGEGATPAGTLPRHQGHEARDADVVDRICQRLKIPNDCRDLARMTVRESGNAARAFELGADAIVSLLERCDAFRRPERFVDMLRACECDHAARAGFSDNSFPEAAYLEAALRAAAAVDAGAVAKVHTAQQIPVAIRAARVAAVAPLVKMVVRGC